VTFFDQIREDADGPLAFRRVSTGITTGHASAVETDRTARSGGFLHSNSLLGGSNRPDVVIADGRIVTDICV